MYQLIFYFSMLLVFLLLTACPNTDVVKNDVGGRVIVAEVVALDQPLTYNRFGSFNPYGIIYALKRDVVDTDKCDQHGEHCRLMDEDTRPGHVRLRKGKRPRPLVLRVNEGDRLVVKFHNMLMPRQPDTSSKETLARLPAKQLGSIQRLGLHYGDIQREETNPVTLPAEADAFVPEITGPAGNPHLAGKDAGDKYCGWRKDLADGSPVNSKNWPRSRCASITISGIAALTSDDPQKAGLETGLVPIAPGETITYRWQFDKPKDDAQSKRKGVHLFFSHGAPSGGEGDGGSLVHGLFGVVNVEPAGSRWYRSQVTKKIWRQVWRRENGRNILDYEATTEDGTSVLNMLKPLGNSRYALIYGDLNAVIREAGGNDGPSGSNPRKLPSFREFTVVFHDELKTFYADEFAELGREFTLAGVRDGFAVNYGASGLGTILLANRKRIGPAKDCVECAYEEFFLESWANGDPALLPDYQDDPSNVHHSYLNDRVIFRNLHAGPKETHVFHLHAHQWLAQDSETGTYLDSQTIAPQQGFSYEIYYGGSGNRNLTPGDSIFHCHLYPHFAQGMWELWRVHDVLEDGSRRLPDGELKAADGRSGTDPLTGEIPPLAGFSDTPSGTPIPAVIPLPGQAMPPEPTYLKDGIEAKGDGFPGYPFYVAGAAGHRAPQAPLDIDEAAGLGRHVVYCPGNKQGVSVCQRMMSGIPREKLKTLSGDELLQHALLTSDFSMHMERAQLRVLPNDGTPLEKIAMAFHSQGHWDTRTPEGIPAKLVVNDSEPKPGAPFADPCRGWTFDSQAFGDRARRYDVSAIQTDLIVNRAGWHDPQARINVLDEDVDIFEGQPTAKAAPFFFRANSGDCIEFHHTNRTHEFLAVDDFQVKTPTDTIGQHIHLVKFDVMASDGSGNGFNYEDGTFSRGAIIERIKAAGHLGVDIQGNPVKLSLPGENEFQTTVQRWYADPLLAHTQQCNRLAAEAKPGWRDDPACQDRTIRTVFTHDHFAPSSIQQHGFYAALLVEPRGAKFLRPDGRDMDKSTVGNNEGKGCKPGEQEGMFKSCAVGTQAMIVIGDDGTEKAGGNYREFAMAVADFALLYDGNHSSAPLGLKDFALLPASKQQALGPLHQQLMEVQRRYGHPVDPPKMPEAISKDHHNPYLVNYRHEPMPLRIGCKHYGSSGVDEVDPSRCSVDSIKRQRPGRKGDMAYVFSSWEHGDPATEIFAGYEGERVQLRVIQGAQEVQHVLNIHGHHWPREVGNPDSPLVAAQEIGISEHFEMQLKLGNVTRRDPFTDDLYNFGSMDDLWNGAWGFIRSFESFLECDALADDADRHKCEAALAKMECGSGKLKDCLKPLPGIPRDRSGRLVLENLDEFMFGGDVTCPVDLKGGRKVTFYIDAVDVGQWLGREVSYDEQLYDPDSLAFILLKRQVVRGPDSVFPSPKLTDLAAIKARLKQAYLQKGHIEPLVLRANAGDCIKVVLYNHLVPQKDAAMADAPGDALMPKIVSLNVEKNPAEGKGGDVTPSSFVSLHPQLLAHNTALSDGAMVGYQIGMQLAGPPVSPGKTPFVEYFWYAGTVVVEGKKLVATPLELGPVNLVSYGDVINHPPHGLIGALIIEPEGATYHDPATGEVLPNGAGIRAEIRYPGGRRFKEFVVFYRDGLNLYYGKQRQGIPVPDCRICDDSYDLGEKGINYSSAPFWLRLGQAPQQRPGAGPGDPWFLPDLNGAYFPRQFFTEALNQALPTPKFTANKGDEVRFRVLQPSGRARQRSFLVYGHDYPDLLPYFGSSHAPLISVGKAITATIDSAKPGYWLYRDGPAQIWAGGAWGLFDVRSSD